MSNRLLLILPISILTIYYLQYYIKHLTKKSMFTSLQFNNSYSDSPQNSVIILGMS